MTSRRPYGEHLAGPLVVSEHCGAGQGRQVSRPLWLLVMMMMVIMMMMMMMIVMIITMIMIMIMSDDDK